MEDAENRTFTELVNGELKTYDIITGELIGNHVLSPIANIRPYTFELGQMISGGVREGLTITKIAKTITGVTAGQIYRWCSMHPDFRHSIAEARRDRAHYFHDKIVEEIEECDNITKDEVAAKKLKIDTMKWVAEKNNAKEYGAKTTIGGDADNPIGLTVISTGIVRAVKEITEDAVEAEYTEVSSDE